MISYRSRIVSFVLSLFIFLGLNSCNLVECDGPGCDPGIEWTYYLVGLKNAGSEENFIVRTADTSLISLAEDQLSLPVSQRNMHVNGALLPGTSYNTGWNWHIDPNDWVLSEFSIELCDGTPSMLEDDLDYWINTVGRFCSWSSYLMEELDF